MAGFVSYDGKIDPIDDAKEAKGTPGFSEYNGSYIDNDGAEKSASQKSSLARRAIGDTAISAVKGAIGLTEVPVGIADLATGGRVGKALEGVGYRPAEAKSFLDEMYSPEQKAANAAVQNAEGFVGTTKAALQNPSTIGQAVVESAPLLLPGAAVARGLGAATKLSPAVAAGLSEGVVGAGLAAEQMRQNSDGGLLSAQQAAASLASGIGTAAFGVAGGKIAQSAIGKRLGMADVDTALAMTPAQRAAAGGANASLAKRIAGGAVSEGVLEELPQSMWEQAAQNYGEGKDLGEGVAEAGAMGMLAGGVMGGGFNALQGPGRQEKKADDGKPDAPLALPAPTYTGTPSDQTMAADVERENQVAAAQANADQVYAERDAFEQQRAPQKLPVTGPMSAAVNVGIDAGAITSPANPRYDVPAQPRGSFSAQAELADLINQERTDLADRRELAQFVGQERSDQAQRISEAAGSRRAMDDALADVDQRVAGAATQEAEAARLRLLNNILSGISDTGNPARQFGNALRRAGYRNTGFTEREQQTIQRFTDARAALNSPEATTVPAAPNELDPAALGIRELANGQQQDNAAPRDKAAEVADLVSQGWRLSVGRTLVSPKGKRRNLNAAEFAAAKEARARINNAMEVGNAAATQMDTVRDQGRRDVGGRSAGNAQPVPGVERGRGADAGASASGVRAPGVVGNAAGAGGALNAAQPEQVAQETPQADGAQVAPAGGRVAASKTPGKWASFPPESGSLGVPRAAMPQIKAEHRGAMTQFMKARGVTHQQETVPADSLRPTQAEFSPGKVRKALGFDGGDRSILVSSDGYVLDGHHQWLAKREKGEAIDVIRFDAPIADLVELANEFPSSSNAAGATTVDQGRGKKAEAAPVGELQEAAGAGVESRADRSAIDTALRRMDRFVAEFERGTMKDSDTQSLGDTPTVLQFLGADNLPLQIDGATVRKTLAGKHRYDVSPQALRNVVQALYDPLAVFRSATGTGLVVLSELQSNNGNPVVAAIHLAKRKGGMIINDVASIHEKTDAEKSIGAWLRDDLLRYVRNENDLSGAATRHLLPASVATSMKGHMDNVATENDVVNEFGPRYSVASGVSAAGSMPLNNRQKMALNVVQRAADKFRAEYSGAAALDIRVVYSRDEIPTRYRPSPYAEGVYHDREGIIYLVASNLPTQQRAWQVLMHESVGHYGLANMMGDKFAGLQATVLKMATAGQAMDRDPQPGERGYETVEAVRRLYPEASDAEVAQEVLARMAETMPDVGWFRMALNRIAAWLKSAARAFGLAFEPTMADVRRTVELAGYHVRSGANLGQDAGVRDVAFASQATGRQSNIAGMPDNSTASGRDNAPAPEADIGEAITLYHGGSSGISEIKPQGPYGGVFASASKESALSHNSVLHEIKLNESEIMRQSDMEDVSDDDLLRAAHWVNPDDVDALRRLVVEDGKPSDADVDLMRADDLSEASIEGQRLRGVIAKNLGYKAVEMSDEHGTSYLVLPGARITKHEPSASANSGAMESRAAVIDRVGSVADRARDIGRRLAGKDAGETAAMFPDLDADQQAFLGKIGGGKTKAADAIRAAFDRAGLKIRQGLVDRYAALKELDEKAVGEDFINTAITDSSWVLAKMSSAGAGALNAMMTTGRIAFDAAQRVITLRGEPNGGLVDVLRQLGGPAEVERWFGWVAANRAEKLMAEGREHLFTADEIAAGKRMNLGKTDDGKARTMLYAKVFSEFNQFRDDVVAIAEQTGVLSAEERAMWKDEFYVPFYRVMQEEGDAKGPRASKGLSRQEAYKKLKGGRENLNDLMENTLMNFHHLLSASLKNQAATQAIRNAEKAGIARRVPESRRDTKTSTFILEGGDRVFYEVDDPMVYEAITSLSDPGLNNFAVRMMSAFKRVFTNMTTVTPQFVIANTFRDLLQAAATSPTSKNIFRTAMQGAASYRDQKTRAEMLAAGGAFSFGHIYGTDTDEIKASLRKNVAGANLISDASMVPEILRQGWKRWNEITDTSENITRAAAYVQNVEQLGKLRAAFEARDIMDFSQHGAWPAVRFMIRVVPFLNARLQGLDKLYRSGAKPMLLTAMGEGSASDKQAAARFASVTGALVLASLALYMANADDDEYQKLEEWQKDTYWFFRIGENAFFLPKPFEVGAISTMAERVAQQMMDDKATGKLFRERLGDMLMQTFAFNPTPQLFQPMIDVYSNKDAFTGRDIETMGMERLSKGLRARDTTTVAAQAVSSASRVFGDETPFAVSPVQADHLIRGYLGTVGAQAAGMIDTIWRTAAGQEAPSQAWSEYQPVKRFYRDLGVPSSHNRYSTLFYDGLREANRVYADVMELQKLGRQDDARELSAENRGLLSMRQALNRDQRSLSEINKRIQDARRSDMDGDQKRQEIDRLTVMKNAITDRSGRLVESIRVAE